MNRECGFNRSITRDQHAQSPARMTRRAVLPVVIFALLSGAFFGCAPRNVTEGIHYAAERSKVADATTVPVRDRNHLRFDSNLRADLEELLHQEAEPSQAQASDLLRAANELSIRQTMEELDRMPPDGFRWLAAHYDGNAEYEDAGAFREGWKKRFRQEAGERLDADLSRLAETDDVRQFLAGIQQKLEVAPGDRGRATRVLLAAPFFIPAAIGAEIADSEAMQRTMVANFEHTLKYSPKLASMDESADDLLSLDLPALATRYAPIFVQQVRPDVAYDPMDDQIGRVFLTGSVDDIQVNVDTAQPVVYWAHSRARIGTNRYDQLTYAVWYPSRPALSSRDVEAGKIDGVVVRLTLDHYRRPAVYEFVRACGCYHTLWVAEFVEAAARAEFGAPPGANHFAIQRTTEGRSLFLPALVRDDGSRPQRPVVFVDAGHHLVMLIKPSGLDEKEGGTIMEKPYELEAYDTLTRLPVGGAVASMFGSDGLVHNAGRQEGLLLAPTGMLSAGQPRQLGTMKIRMDAYDHDDPRLLERNLRFPTGF